MAESSKTDKGWKTRSILGKNPTPGLGMLFRRMRKAVYFQLLAISWRETGEDGIYFVLFRFI